MDLSLKPIIPLHRSPLEGCANPVLQGSSLIKPSFILNLSPNLSKNERISSTQQVIFYNCDKCLKTFTKKKLSIKTQKKGLVKKPMAARYVQRSMLY